MNKEDDHGFTEVVPGILVGRGVKVEIPHPDPIWVVRNPDETASLGSSGNIYIFSSEEKARGIMDDEPEDSYKIQMYSWDDLVDTFGSHYRGAMVDPGKEPGFCQTVPLRKGI